MELDHKFALYWLCRMMLSQTRYSDLPRYYSLLNRYHPDEEETADITDRILAKCPDVVGQSADIEV